MPPCRALAEQFELGFENQLYRFLEEVAAEDRVGTYERRLTMRIAVSRLAVVLFSALALSGSAGAQVKTYQDTLVEIARLNQLRRERESMNPAELAKMLERDIGRTDFHKLAAMLTPTEDELAAMTDLDRWIISGSSNYIEAKYGEVGASRIKALLT